MKQNTIFSSFQLPHLITLFIHMNSNQTSVIEQTRYMLPLTEQWDKDQPPPPDKFADKSIADKFKF